MVPNVMLIRGYYCSYPGQQCSPACRRLVLDDEIDAEEAEDVQRLDNVLADVKVSPLTRLSLISRASVGAAAAGAVGALGAIPAALASGGGNSIKMIVTDAVTAEALAVTFLTGVIENAKKIGIPGSLDTVACDGAHGTSPPTSSGRLSVESTGVSPRAGTGQFFTACGPTGSFGTPCRFVGPAPRGVNPRKFTFTAPESSAIWRLMYFSRRSTRSGLSAIGLSAQDREGAIEIAFLVFLKHRLRARLLFTSSAADLLPRVTLVLRRTI